MQQSKCSVAFCWVLAGDLQDLVREKVDSGMLHFLLIGNLGQREDPMPTELIGDAGTPGAARVDRC